MLTRTFEYKGFDGEMHKDTWHFNYTQAELLKMELSAQGGMSALMSKLYTEERNDEIVNIFEKIILGAVGVKSPDGRRFVKNEATKEDFYATQAYSDLFTELVTDPKKLVAFLQGCVPEELRAEMLKEEAVTATEDKIVEMPVV